MNPSSLHPVRAEQLRLQTRRHFLSSAGQFSLGAIALQALQGNAFAASANTDHPLAPKRPPLKARAKRVIYLHMSADRPTSISLTPSRRWWNRAASPAQILS